MATGVCSGSTIRLRPSWVALIRAMWEEACERRATVEPGGRLAADSSNKSCA